MNILSGKWRWFKIGLLLVLLLLVGYFGQIWLDKRAQWQAFLELEQEQLAIVTADGFIEREFGVDSENRVTVTHVSGYSRYFHEYAPNIYAVEAVKAFLEHAPEPVFKEFTLTYSTLEAGIGDFGYPVSWCGEGYCDFNPDLVQKMDGGTVPIASNTFHTEDVEVDGYKFSISYSLDTSDVGQVWHLYIKIGSEPRNIWDEFWAEILQIPSRYSFRTIYRVNYVTGWTYFREDLQDG